MGGLPIEAASEPAGDKPAEPKTQWDKAHATNRAERRRLFKEHAPRADRLQAFGDADHARRGRG